MAVEAVYFDGETARDNRVVVSLETSGLHFSGEGVLPQDWSLSGLSATEPPQPGQPLRLSHGSHAGARLSLRNDDFSRQLLTAAPHLAGGFSSGHAKRLFLWIGGGLAVLAALVYLTLNFAPRRLAVLLPDAWSKRVGEQMEASLVAGARNCQMAAGERSIAALLAILAEGNSDMPPLRVRVYDIPIVNAFALPGGNIVLTRGLLNAAVEVNEVAGVLAHEIGHVAHHHPEAQMVRIAGMQVLISIATGTSGGNNLSSIAGLAAILKSSRDAEREADAYAVATLSAAHVDPLGLKHFFEKILADEGKSTGGALTKLGTVFSTHPVTTERIDLIKPLPANEPLKVPLTDGQWQDLKAICG